MVMLAHRRKAFRSGGGGAAWPDIDTASYDSKSFSISEDSYPYGICFKPDGTKMYIAGNNNKTVYQYSLSTAWDVSTASYDSKSFNTGGNGCCDVDFKTDGTVMYVSYRDGSNNTQIRQYNLSTAWDISTASYDDDSINIEGGTTLHRFYLKNDGTKLYSIGPSTDTVYQYSLSTAWDMDTLSYDSKSKLVSSEDSAPAAVWFSSDGAKMYVLGTTNDDVFQYSLSTPWDVSTASYASKSYAIGQTSTTCAMCFKSDGSKMYVCGYSSAVAYQYSLGS
jgi:hypothetical protein